MVDLVVVGGGPAGLACARAAADLGLQVVVVEELALGGELNTVSVVTGLTGRPEPVSGPDLAADLIEGALAAGVDVLYAQAESIERDGDLWSVNSGAVRATALVLATGRVHDLDAVPGAAELHGRGVSTCSSCDGPLFKGKDVLVLGAGRDAAATVRDLQPLVASVTVLPSAPLSRLEEALMTGAGAVVGGHGTGSLAVAETGVELRLGGDRDGEVLRYDGVFLATPRRPRAELLAASDVPDGGPFVTTIGDVRPTSSETVEAAIGEGVAAAWQVARLSPARPPAGS